MVVTKDTLLTQCGATSVIHPLRSESYKVLRSVGIPDPSKIINSMPLYKVVSYASSVNNGKITNVWSS